MSEKRHGFSLAALGHSVALLTGGTIVAQLVGIGRELFIANQVGLSSRLDALLIALVIPTTLAGALTSGAITALVPAYMDSQSHAGATSARTLAGAVLGWVSAAGLLLTLALHPLADWAIGLVGPGLDQTSRADGVAFLRIVAPMAVLGSATAILGAVCQAEAMFRALALSAIATPGVTLLVTVAMWNSFGLIGVAVGSLLGVTASLIVVSLALQRGPGLPRLNLRVRGIGLGPFVRHAVPLTLSSAVLQVNVVADRAVASILAPGAVSALRYAEALVRAPIAAIGPAWSQALYPAMVRAAVGNDALTLGQATERALRYGAALLIPMAMLTAAVAPVAVRVAYGRGAFDAQDVAVTSAVVAGFAPLVFALLLSPVLVGAHNALRRGSTLLVVGALNVLVNVVLDIALGLTIGVAGVALATSISAVVGMGILAWRLSRAAADFSPFNVLRTALRATAAAAAPALVATWICWGGVIGPETPSLMGLAWLGLVGVAGITGYAAFAAIIGPPEAPMIVRAILERRWRTGGS